MKALFAIILAACCLSCSTDTSHAPTQKEKKSDKPAPAQVDQPQSKKSAPRRDASVANKGPEQPAIDPEELTKFLHRAAASNDIPRIEELLSQGARLDWVDGKGREALDHAAYSGAAM